MNSTTTTATYTLDQYRKLLSAHDWEFEYSDDHSAWLSGSDSLKRLRSAQRTLDPLGTVWNEYAPRGHQIVSK